MTGIQMMTMGKKLSNAYAEICTPLCREYDLNQTCFDILMFVANNPEHNTARDVCELRGIKSGIASVSIDTMVKKGYLTYACDDGDRRKHRLKPTAKSEALIAKGRERQSFFAEMLKNGITEREMLIFQSVLAKIQNNLTDFKTV